MKFLNLLLLLLFCSLSAQTNYLSDLDEKSDKIVKNFRDKHSIPGISISISIKNELIYTKGFGYADLEQKKPVNPALTKFRIASISKTITAITLAKLQEEGKIDIKESIYKYLDSLPNIGYQITVESLLSHRSGLIRDYERNILCGKNDFHKVNFNSSFTENKFQYRPETRFSYSNYGYKLLGILIEKVSQKTITEAKKDYVISKLGLKNTVPETNLSDENISKFYYKKFGKMLEVPCIDCSFNYGPGCYLSTSEDLVRLGNGYLYKNQLISENSFRNLIKTRNEDKNYGLGFMVMRDYYKNYFFGHNGSYPGAASYLRIYPANELVISVLMNYRDDIIISELDSFVSEVVYNYVEKNNKKKN